MGIFAHDEGFLFVVVLAILDATGVSGIHRTVDIGIGTGVVSLFKVDEAAGVFLFDPVVTGLEVRTVATLVAHRPQDDARMVEVALHVALVAFQMRFLVSRVLGQRLFLEAHAVAFEIGFGHDVKAVTVAQFIPIRIVRIMAGAHGIDIEFLHELYVLEHPLAGDIRASVGIHLMTVYSFDEHGLPIYQKLAVLDFDFPESHFYGYDFADGVSVFQCSPEGVEVGRLCRPFMRVLHRHDNGWGSRFADFFHADGFPACIE